MLITRTPLRISIGGGGTDLPSYYQQFGAVVISAAISKYIYISINETFTDDYFLKYSELERVRAPKEVAHPIIRSALELHDIGPSVEIVSMADIPAGTGLGSSGTFTVGLLRSLYAFKRQHVDAGALAEEACRIEIDMLGRSVGKQDQYIASFGGLTTFDFNKDGTVVASPLGVSTETMHDLSDHLLMFFTGYSRDANNVLDDQKKRSEKGDSSMLDNLHFVKELGLSIKAALERGDTHAFARMMHEHWMRKRGRSQQMSNDRINTWYDLGMANGALGGKLVGAGGGGFLLFYAEDRARLRGTMREAGLTEVRFEFDFDGSRVVTRS
jgi:D-glycero-alpha-D-manno-heptose-7-phosphate kinase